MRATFRKLPETRAVIGRRRGPADFRAWRLMGRSPARSRGRLPRSALISVLLHLVVIAALVIFMQRQLPEQYVPPAPIAMVFQHGGAPRATAPPAARHGPPETAALEARREQPLPPPPPAAPPAPAIPAPPGVAVHLPSAAQLQAFLEPPLPQAQPPPPAPARPARAEPTHARAAPAPLPPHTLFVPSLSFGTPAGGEAESRAPARPRRGLNLALNRSELQRAFAPDFAVEGKIGPDWLALLTRWVDQRKYYPYSAAEMGQQGTVELRLVIERNGRVAAASLLQSSGSPFLDQAWLGMFRGSEVPAFPAGTKARQIIIRATMHYILID